MRKPRLREGKSFTEVTQLVIWELRFEPRMKGSRLCILPSYCMLLAGAAVGRLI